MQRSDMPMIDINEMTDSFERSVVELVNNAELPMVNIELVLNKVLSAVRDAKIRAIRDAKTKNDNNNSEVEDGEKS